MLYVFLGFIAFGQILTAIGIATLGNIIKKM